MPNEDEDILKQGEVQDSNAMETLLQQSEVQPEHEEEIEEDGKTEQDAPPAPTPPDPTASDDQAVTTEDEGEEEEDKEEKPTQTEADKKAQAELEQKPNETDEEWEARIDKIKPKRGASEKTRNAIKEIKQFAKTERKARKEAEKLAKQYKEQIDKGEVLTPERKKQVDEDRLFRQAFDIENDPEFNNKFDQQIKKGEETAIALLRTWKLPESAAKYIQENGGIVRFRTSNELMPSSITKEDGTRITHAEWWASKVESNLTPAQKEALGDELLNLRQLSRAREQAVKDAQANRESFLQKKKTEAEAAAKDWNDRILKHAPEVLATYGEIAKKKDIPDNATPEQKAEIEAHNQRFEKAQQIAGKYITEITPENLTEAAIAAGYVTIVQEELTNLRDKTAKSDARIKELEQQITDMKASGKTIGKGTVSGKNNQPPTRRLSDEDAMAEAIKNV